MVSRGLGLILHEGTGGRIHNYSALSPNETLMRNFFSMRRSIDFSHPPVLGMTQKNHFSTKPNPPKEMVRKGCDWFKELSPKEMVRKVCNKCKELLNNSKNNCNELLNKFKELLNKFLEWEMVKEVLEHGKIFTHLLLAQVRSKVIDDVSSSILSILKTLIKLPPVLTAIFTGLYRLWGWLIELLGWLVDKYPRLASYLNELKTHVECLLSKIEDP